MICQTPQLPGLCEEGSCSSIDVSVGQSFSRAPPQSHRLSTRYTTCLCSWKRTQTDVLVRTRRGRRHTASRSGYKVVDTGQPVCFHLRLLVELQQSLQPGKCLLFMSLLLIHFILSIRCRGYSVEKPDREQQCPLTNINKLFWVFCFFLFSKW